MCFERAVAGGRRDDGSAWGEGVAGYEDVCVGGTAAFGGDDLCEVGRGDFVDGADEAFGPVLGRRGFGQKGGFFGVG